MKNFYHKRHKDITQNTQRILSELCVKKLRELCG